jgi:hypothetical protein
MSLFSLFYVLTQTFALVTDLQYRPVIKVRQWDDETSE